MSKVETKKKFMKMPHVYAIMIVIIMLAGVATHLIPAGSYTRETINGVTKVDPNSFTYIEPHPVAFLDWFTAITKGFVQSATIIATMLVGSAFFGIYTESGAFQNFINILLKSANKKTTTYMMIGFMSFFAIRSGFTGILDGNLVFTPLTVGFALAAGYDALTGVALTLVPTFMAFAFAPANPYTVLICHNIIGLPVYSGFAFRMIVFMIVMALLFHHIIKYANMVKEDKSKSLVADTDVSDLTVDDSKFNEKLSPRQILIIVMLFSTIAIVVATSLLLKWGLNEMIATLVISGILAGIVLGYSFDTMADMVNRTGKTFYLGALCVVLARAIYVVLAEGMILDTIVHALAIPLGKVSGVFTSVLLLLVTTVFNFFVGSGSAKAAIMMPIISPLASILGITQQTAVLAYQYGDGLTNIIYPTSGLVFAFLAMGKVEYTRYLRFIMPLIFKLFVLSIVAIVIAYSINYGPF